MAYQRKDAQYRQAKAAGYRARSAWKLIELDRRFRLLARGERVVDLGTWPGAWAQVAVERVGPAGKVVGLDLVAPAPLAGADFVQGDVRDPEALSAVRQRLGGPAGLVLSDIAPKLTGVRDTDEARAAELVAAVLDALPAVLRPGGTLVIKLFMNAAHAAIVGRLQSLFDRVQSTRPDSTRKGSSEVYAIASGYRPPCG